MKTRVDLLVVSAAEVVPLTEGPATGARRGEALGRVEGVPQGAVAVAEGRVVEVGPTERLLRRYEAGEVLEAAGMTVVPGFVDAHTHPVFLSTREEEFHRRMAGEDYLSITRAGGGILSSVRGVREAAEADLLERVAARCDAFLAHGTTTIEAKSGYGLDLEGELKSLRVLDRLRRAHALRISPTFLGAHAVPPEFAGDPDGYVEVVVERMLPAARGLAHSCDVFAEPGFFDLAQSERILRAAAALGFRLRLHADEIVSMGGARLAARLGADAADHLVAVDEEGIRALAGSRTVAVLLPGTSFLLRKPPASARRMVEAGCAVALATDFNPGTCFSQSLPAIMTLAAVLYGMGPGEMLTACTLNAAASLGLDGEVGSLHPGKRADLAFLEMPSHKELGYRLGGNPVRRTLRDGRTVVRNVTEHVGREGA